MKFLKEKSWHELFEIGILIKGFNGIWELFAGIIILFLKPLAIGNFFINLTKKELTEDPKDFITVHLINSFQNLSFGTKEFAGLYILAHGILNLFLAVSLYKEKLWSYVVAIICMGSLIIYQIYRIGHTHSIVLSIITLVDILFLGVIWHEYRYQLNKLGNQ